MRTQLEIYRKEGYSRLEKDGAFLDISDVISQLEGNDEKEMEYMSARLLIDRLAISNDKDEISRLTDSLETAYFEGHDKCIVKIWEQEGVREKEYSRQFSADGIEFREPSELMFNFNNPYGACPACEGFGKILGISEDLVVPDKTLSVYQDAVQCFRGEKMGEWKKWLIKLSSSIGFPIHKPYMDLSREERTSFGKGKVNGKESTVSSDG